MTKRPKNPEASLDSRMLSAGQRLLRRAEQTNYGPLTSGPALSAAQQVLRRALQAGARQHIPVPGQAAEAEVVIEPIASPEDLGALVRSVRTKRGMSQQEFADLAGVGRRFVSELERGKPTLEIGRVLTVLLAAGIDLVAKER